jgi:hypothetical protein
MNQPPMTAVLATQPLAIFQQAASKIDSVVFAAFFLAAAMPFGLIILVPVGFIRLSGFNLVYILLTCLLLLKILLLGRIHFSGTAAFLSLTVAVYVLGSVARRAANLHGVFSQLRAYWPFAIAVLLLAAGTNADVRKFFRYTAQAMIISASSALLLHYFFTSYVERLFESVPDAVLTIKIGRMQWDSEPAVFFLLLYFVVRDKHSRINRLLAGSALLLGAAATFGTQDRTPLAGMLAFAVGSIFIASGWRDAVRRIGQTFGISLLFVATIGALLMVDSRIREMASLRFLGGDGGAQTIYQVDLVLGRIEMYRQYWNSITEHFPWGQGFGLPYSAVWQKEVPITDISLMAFLLPLGVFGLAIFGLFIRALWRIASHTSGKLPSKYGRAIKLLIIVSLLVSLNVDIYSRNNFVVQLTLLVLCCRNGILMPDGRQLSAI